MEQLLATAGGIGAYAPIQQVQSVPPHATRNFLLMALLVAVLAFWAWWRVGRAP